jgi:hypothetical protein
LLLLSSVYRGPRKRIWLIAPYVIEVHPASRQSLINTAEVFSHPCLRQIARRASLCNRPRYRDG